MKLILNTIVRGHIALMLANIWFINNFFLFRSQQWFSFLHMFKVYETTSLIIHAVAMTSMWNDTRTYFFLVFAYAQ